MRLMIHSKKIETQHRLGLTSESQQRLHTPASCPHPEAKLCQAAMLSIYPAIDDVGIEAIVLNMAALAQAQQAAISLDDSVHDWDMMFRAVKARLTAAVGQVLVATPGLQPQVTAVLVQTVVLECVSALSQLHASLTQERGQRDELEQELEQAASNAKAMLATGRARTALAEAANTGFVS